MWFFFLRIFHSLLAWLVGFFFFETWSHCVAEAGSRFKSNSLPSTSPMLGLWTGATTASLSGFIFNLWCFHISLSI